MRVAVLDDYQEAVPHLDCFAKLAAHDVTVHSGAGREEALAGTLRDVEAVVLIRERTIVDRELLTLLPKLRLIAQTAAGVAHVDIEECARRGVFVCAGGGSPVATAELTFALILAARRHLSLEVSRLRAGEWQSTIGVELHGRTLGVYGYGRIGTLVASFGRAFGMRVLVWGREGSIERARADGLEVAPARGSLFTESDVLTLHLRLTEGTRGAIRAPDLAQMRPSALLVNTARAGLIEPGALAAALLDGRPGGAAVDVFDEEPARPGSEPLLSLDNALCTPHLGYVTRESYELYLGRAFDAVNAFAAGEPIDVVSGVVAGTEA